MKPPRKHVATGNQPGGAAPRDKDGLTPRQRLDSIKAAREAWQFQRERALYISREDVDRTDKEFAEILMSDLTALANIAGARVAGKKLTIVQAREIITGVIREMCQRWIDAKNITDLKNG